MDHQNNEQFMQDSSEVPIWPLDLEYYQIPTYGELDGLCIELYVLLSVFGLTLCFAIYNITVFLVIQRRYKNWLITIFYVFSCIVLITRMCEYGFLLQFYGRIKIFEETWNKATDGGKLNFFTTAQEDDLIG